MTAGRFRAAIFLALVFFAGCDRAPEKNTVTGRAGETITLPKAINTIISTAPSNSEIIVGLGLGGKIIAADEFSARIDGINKGITLIDFSYPDGETIITLNPDIIIAAEHNRTVSGDDPFRLMGEAGIPVVYIPTSGSIEGIYGDIRFIAGLLGAGEKGEALVAGMKAEIGAVAQKSAGITERKSVYIELSPPPYIVSLGRKTYLHEMAETIGADNIFADQEGWFSPSAEAVISRNPDVIITFFDDLGTFTADLKARPGFEHIGAVRDNRVFRLDANSASRPSQNIVLALKQMARAVYPEIYEAP
ncbi:MAG: ABC transporter substrate-binding protein [Spirochaetaceae bacterium]|jgi:iron complex transport system substrate-binding protein|nr:ABC transporter substrate-binding protein [Spirochaetaceae bacterium]